MAKCFCGLLVFLALVGCNRRLGTTVEAVPQLSPADHLTAAEALKAQTDDWPLVLWHYQQFLETAAEAGLPAAEIDRARLQFEELRRSYVALYAGAASNALEAENAALRRANQTLTDQSERLKADNAVLNSTLLKMQQATR